MAVPKGRILKEFDPLLKKAGITPEDDFYSKNTRKIQFATNLPQLDLIQVRSFDVATFVAFGAAQIGVAGSDVLAEFNYDNIHAPVDLGIGKCRMSVAELEDDNIEEKLSELSHIRIATKYVNITKRYFEAKGIQAECIKLNGAMEIAPRLGMVRRIVDLVSTGSTLKANKLKEVEKIMDISSRLIVNKTASKLQADELQGIVDRFNS